MPLNATCGQKQPAARSVRQRGVAIISVLLTVALATIIVSGLLMREHTTVRSVENRLALTQTRWVERAAIDWSKVILAADARGSNVDHLGEAWAVEVEETRLDETVTAGAQIDDDTRAATLSGQISDAQARININALTGLGPDGLPTVLPQRVEILRRLLDVLGQPTSLADAIAARVLAAVPPPDGSEVAALTLARIDDLRSVRGMRDSIVDALEPHVAFLPREAGQTKINVNTASAEVLAAALGIDLALARRAVDRRERETFFKDLEYLRTEVLALPDPLDATLLDLRSNFFHVLGLIRFGRVESFSETLLERKSNANRVTVIWQRRL